MSLSSGTKLGVYEIVALIGKGGMGEVYRARDPNLERDVAIKVLPEELASDDERVSRLKREAKLLASLNHPNIASIHGLEQNALVLELVEGPTLAERITRGGIPVDEAVAIAKQIAGALEAGHEAGVIHRDLKPANVKIKDDGTVKVLDYGLAKALEGDAPTDDDGELSRSPTLTRQGTQLGMILGTAAYMSPEQAKGKRVDKRADVWAFGVVLFEMLTGEKLFRGDTVSEALASVIKDDPDWSRLPGDCPRHVRALLRRCLTRDPKLRLRDIGEARIALGDVVTDSPPVDSKPRASLSLWRKAMPWAVAAAFALAVALAVSNQTPVPSLPVTRTIVTLPADEAIPRASLSPLAFSPDGSLLVYAAQKGSDPAQLYLRSMNSLEAEPIAGTEGGDDPFFSPDGQWLGFFAAGELRKIPISGGAVFTITRIGELPQGARWGSDGRIIIGAVSAERARWVSEEGGTQEELASVDATGSWPEIMPESQVLLFDNDGAIVGLRLDTGERKVLVQDGSYAHYLSTGHLVYFRAGTLWAAPFAPGRLELSGPPVPVLEGIRSSGNFRGGAHFAVSRTGTLAYVPGKAEYDGANLVWVDRQGVADQIPAPARPYEYPRLSPDGRRVATSISGGNVWTYDVTRNVLTRLTLEPELRADGNRSEMNAAPVWSPDAQRVAFVSSRDGPRDMYWQMTDGTGGLERLTTNSYQSVPSSFSPDGQWLAFTESKPDTGRDIWILDLAERKATAFIATRYEETAPAFSPDGKWIAYSSDESGRREVYVQAYPGPGEKWQISAEGGQEPVWNPSGGELFYRHGSRMMAVAVGVDAESALTAGKPQLLFEGPYEPTPFSFANYDVSPDGQRFLMLEPVAPQTERADHIVVVLNWTSELERLVPTR